MTGWPRSPISSPLPIRTIEDVVREEFTVQIPFEGNQTQIVATEEVEPRIPLRAEESAADYKMLRGPAV